MVTASREDVFDEEFVAIGFDTMIQSPMEVSECSVVIETANFIQERIKKTIESNPM